MRSLLLLCAIILIGLGSCDSKAEENKQNNDETPAPLQEKKSSGISLSKGRSYGDLVESLYEELEKENPALQQLEDDINNVMRQKADSAEAFETFWQKNNSYYSAAENRLSSIQDSLLRVRVKVLLQNSLAVYNNRAQAGKNLLEILERKNTSLHDLYAALKLIKTLPVMDKYQQTHLPEARSLENANRQYDKVITDADKLTRN